MPRVGLNGRSKRISEGKQMGFRSSRWLAAIAAACLCCGAAQAAPGAIDGARIIGADSEPGNWLAHGRTYGEQRFSPLDAINADNVGQLGLAWFADLGTRRGLEATPIVVDGVIYTTGDWSRVYAIDAATGKQMWAYDPKVPREWGVTPAAMW
jgi:glucose dehydrogenase